MTGRFRGKCREVIIVVDCATKVLALKEERSSAYLYSYNIMISLRKIQVSDPPSLYIQVYERYNLLSVRIKSP